MQPDCSRGSQRLSKLGSRLARFELNDEPLASAYCKCKIALRQAQGLARLSYCRSKLSCIIYIHLTDREDMRFVATMEDTILPIGMNGENPQIPTGNLPDRDEYSAGIGLAVNREADRQLCRHELRVSDCYGCSCIGDILCYTPCFRG